MFYVVHLRVMVDNFSIYNSHVFSYKIKTCDFLFLMIIVTCVVF